MKRIMSKLRLGSCIFAALLVSFTSSANTLERAFIEYRNGNVSQAAQIFESLLPIGNSVAAMNLAVLHYSGNGVPQSPAHTLGYLYVAESLGHTGVGDALANIDLDLTEEEQVQAREIYQRVMANQWIQTTPFEPAEEPVRLLPTQELEWQSRTRPERPVEYEELDGSENVMVAPYIYVVNRAGDVVAVDSPNSEHIPFDEEIRRTLEGWRATEGPRGSLQSVTLGFVESDRAKVIQSIQDRDWELALRGNVNAQLELADKLSTFVGDGMPRMLVTDYVEIRPPSVADVEGDRIPLGAWLPPATIVVDEHLDLQEVNLSGASRLSDSERTSRTERIEQFNFANVEGLQPGAYRVHPDHPDQLISFKNWPITWTSLYWLEQAATNGERAAQRQLALSHPEWMAYLVDQEDAFALTWRAVVLITRAEREADRNMGRQLLERAVAQGYPQAIAIKEGL
ncbi:MAG: hypothetical protein JJU10_10280 [Idiomarina sp.]|nr:hypothetical protein [Idiomarina sp.]